MDKKGKSVFWRLFIPLMLVMAIQGIICYGTIIFSGASKQLDNNAIDILNQAVNNRQIILQNLIEQWSGLDTIITKLNAELNELAIKEKKNVIIEEEAFREEFLENSMETILAEFRKKTVTGIFLILAKEDMKEGQDVLDGVYLRDADPMNSPDDYSDMILKRGDSINSHLYGIPLDQSWKETYKFTNIDEFYHGSYDFFYKPYHAAIENPEVSYNSLGYWSDPFYLEEEGKNRTEEIITYSVPLISKEGKVYGVLGVEINLFYLYSYLPEKELDGDKEGGYLLIKYQDLNSCKIIGASGRSFKNMQKEDITLNLIPQEQKQFYQVNGFQLLNQDVYGSICSLELYKKNTPFFKDTWALLGVVEENYIFGIGKELSNILILAILFSLGGGMIGIYMVSLFTTRPIIGLAQSIHSSKENELPDFQKSHIKEVDEVYNELCRLMTKQQEIEKDLLEERERYFIALESAADIIYEYSVKKDSLILYNFNEKDTNLTNQTLHCFKRQLQKIDIIHKEDRENFVQFLEGNWNGDSFIFRARLTNDIKEYQWLELKGKKINDLDNNLIKIIGSAKNISEQKQRELAEIDFNQKDQATGLLKRKVGEFVIQSEIDQGNMGSLMLMDLDNFRVLNNDYGLSFGDLILEEISVLIQKLTKEEDILVRCGGDEFLIWLYKKTEEEAKKIGTQICQNVKELYAGNSFSISVTIGTAQLEEREAYQTLFRHTEEALLYAKRKERGMIIGYSELSKKTDEIMREEELINEIASISYDRQIDIVPLALNLFDKAIEIEGVIPVLLARIGRQFDLDDIIISQGNLDFYTNRIVYQWHKGGIPYFDSKLSRYMGEEFERNIELLTDEGLVFDKTRHIPEKVKEFFYIPKDGNGVCYKMYDQGTYMGAVMYSTYKEEEWREGEKNTLQEMARIIAANISKVKLDLASRAKSEFLSRMSHEIRTPMNAIIGMTDIALEQEQIPDKVNDCLHKIEFSSRYLLALLNDILDMSKIESGKMKLIKKDFDMNNLIEEVDMLMRSQVEAKQISLEVETDMQDSIVTGDSLRLNQILINLLGNAVKFTKEGGKIVLSAKQKKREENKVSILFMVKDNGIGISKENAARIFNAFEQASENTASQYGGTGLGLSISNRLVHMMGGKIELVSEVNKGCEFSFQIEFPIASISAAELHKKEEKKEIQEEFDFKGRNILLAEDNDLNAEIAETILKSRGIIVEIVKNGLEAKEKFEASSIGEYDAILMDIRMPVMDGLQATKEIRKLSREDARSIPIIAMTANAFDEDTKKSMESGMNGHLAKPIDVQALFGTLKEALQQKRQ